MFFFVRPAGNRTGNLLLMRRVWYHKTTASALLFEVVVVELESGFGQILGF
jgi:hypothetical protein